MNFAPSINTGDGAVLGELYSKLRPLALSKTHYLTGSLAVAQDIVHDVFESLIAHPKIFASELQAYKWIYITCHHRGIDFLRGRKRRAEILESSNDLVFAEPKTPEIRIANQQIFNKMLERLDKRQAEILSLLVIDGLSHAEISELLAISTKTVQRAVIQIQQSLSSLRGIV